MYLTQPRMLAEKTFSGNTKSPVVSPVSLNRLAQPKVQFSGDIGNMVGGAVTAGIGALGMVTSCFLLLVGVGNTPQPEGYRAATLEQFDAFTRAAEGGQNTANLQFRQLLGGLQKDIATSNTACEAIFGFNTLSDNDKAIADELSTRAANVKQVSELNNLFDEWLEKVIAPKAPQGFDKEQCRLDAQQFFASIESVDNGFSTRDLLQLVLGLSVLTILAGGFRMFRPGNTWGDALLGWERNNRRKSGRH